MRGTKGGVLSLAKVKQVSLPSVTSQRGGLHGLRHLSAKCSRVKRRSFLLPEHFINRQWMHVIVWTGKEKKKWIGKLNFYSSRDLRRESTVDNARARR